MEDGERSGGEDGVVCESGGLVCESGGLECESGGLVWCVSLEGW